MSGRARSILAAGLAATVWAAIPGAAAAEIGGEPLARTPADALAPAEAERTWDPERIAAAPPLELAPGGGVALGAPEPELFRAPVARRDEGPVGAGRYPNRVHGKLVGRFPGLGDFSCSATVVSSRSGSLLTTAGHCVRDVRSGTTASELAFAPGYGDGRMPYGVWPVRNLIVPGAWARVGSLDYDFALLRTGKRGGRTLQRAVGSRGIGFGQPKRLRVQAYGYPSAGRPAYDGRRLIRCGGRTLLDPARFGGPRGRGLRCDQEQGASGGGWVAQGTFVVSNTSHGYPPRPGFFFGPTYAAEARDLYSAKVRGWPSIGPIRCGGKVATIVGTDRGERIRGTKGSDVIATIGGADRVEGRGGRDRICGGSGNDRLRGGGGRDTVVGGPGRDSCGARKGNRLRDCERG